MGQKQSFRPPAPQSKNFDTFLFFSGDGDFASLYKLLIDLHKQVIVIFAHGHMGKEVYQIKKGIFTKAIDKLEANLFI
ncbi:MAG: NYN domain-containing protein [Candidatus Levybacteria bacterium]|nr:NYN domain-containing protein [Candidatus Levybacteria bacterium]